MAITVGLQVVHGARAVKARFSLVLALSRIKPQLLSTKSNRSGGAENRTENND